MNNLTAQQKINSEIHLHARVCGYTHGLLVGMETYVQHPTDEYLGVSDERTMVKTMNSSVNKLSTDNRTLKHLKGATIGPEHAKEYRKVYSSLYATAHAIGWSLSNPNVPIPVHEYKFKH